MPAGIQWKAHQGIEGPLGSIRDKMCREGERHDTPLSAGVYNPDHAETLISLWVAIPADCHRGGDFNSSGDTDPASAQ